MLSHALGWGFALWLIGYVLGILLFAVVPTSLIGWILVPIGTVITLWVLWNRISAGSFGAYLLIGISWAMIAVAFDYLFIVQAFKPADGYYKPDVYLYYALTLLLPLAVGWYKNRSVRSEGG